jgi:tetratricopeptide (TPR) repeat protein
MEQNERPEQNDESSRQESHARREPSKPNPVVALVRLPFDILFLTLDFLRVTWWVITQVPRSLTGMRKHTFKPLTAGGTRNVSGHATRQCALAAKYGNLFMIRLLFPSLRRMVDDDGMTFVSWGKVRSRRPISVGRYLLSAVLVVGFWAILVGVLGPQFGADDLLARVRRRITGGQPAQTAQRPGAPATSQAEDPQLAKELVEQAQKSLDEGNVEEARENFSKAARFDPSNVQAQIGLASTARRLGARDSARAAFEKALEVEPDNPQAIVGLADVLHEQGAQKAAIDLLTDLIAKKPGNIRARVLLSESLAAGGNPEGAFAQATAAVELAPSDVDAALALGQAELLRNRLDAAESQFRRAIDLDEHATEAKLGLAKVLNQSRRYPQAEALLLTIISEKPDYLDAVNELVDMYAKTGKTGKALRLAESVTRKNPKAYDLRRRLGALLLTAQRYNELYKEATSLLEDDPGNISAHLQLALMYIQKGLPAIAVEHCRKALAQNANLREAHRVLASAYLADGDTEKAQMELELILRAMPDDLDSLLKMARTYQMQGKNDEALETARKASEKYPDAVEPVIHITQTYYVMENMQEALGYARKAYEMAPDNTLVINNLAALITYTDGDLDEAYSLATKARQREPASPVVAETLGWLYVLRNEPEKGLPLLLFAVQQAPGSPETRYHYAKALHDLGRTKEARAQLEAAFELSNKFLQSDKAAQLLAQIKSTTGTGE